MEVACSFDEFAQVLVDGGYINENSYFNDAADLPSMLRVFESKTGLDSPESFPESPCSDEDIARVLEITQMSSPSLLESCIPDNFSGIPASSQNDILDSDIVSMTKTKDPCITNAVLHDVFSNSTTSTTTIYSGRPAGSLDGFCLSSNIFNNPVSVNLNHLIDAKENDVLNTSYFDSTPVLSPLSDVDPLQPTPPQYTEQTIQSNDRINGESVAVSSGSAHDSFEVTPGRAGTVPSKNENNEVPAPQTTNSAQKRKRKRKSYSKSKSSKSKRSKNKSSTSSSKPQSKPKKAKISDVGASKTSQKTASNRKQGQIQTAASEKDISGNHLAAADEDSEANNTATTSCQKEETPSLRRSSRSTRNTENYNFRISSLVKRVETERRQVEPKQPKGKAKPPPLSKYRRRTANARERDRMKEINDAFDVLKQSLPSVEEESKQKMTKFTILKLALNYISALKDMLGYPDGGEGQSQDAFVFGDFVDEGSIESTDTDMASTSTPKSVPSHSQSSGNVDVIPPSISEVSNHGESIPSDRLSIEYNASNLER